MGNKKSQLLTCGVIQETELAGKWRPRWTDHESVAELKLIEPESNTKPVYSLPLRDELTHWVLRELHDNVITDNPSPQFLLSQLKALSENLDHECLQVIKTHPQLIPPIHLDYFKDRELQTLSELLCSCVREGIFIHHLKILQAGKYCLLDLPNWKEESRFRDKFGALVKTLSLSYKISTTLMEALENMLNDYFPNLQALTFDFTVEAGHPWFFPRPYSVQSAEFRTPLKLQKLAFQVRPLSPSIKYTKIELKSISKLIAKLIRSCSFTTLKYLNLDFYLYEFYKCIYNELKQDDWRQMSNLQTLVFFQPIFNIEEMDASTNADSNRVTDFLTQVAGSVKNVYLKSYFRWEDSDRETGTPRIPSEDMLPGIETTMVSRIPKIPTMSKVETLGISSNSPLTVAFKILKSFPHLKTMILVCLYKHGIETCSCLKREINPQDLLDQRIKPVYPLVTLLAIERCIGRHPVNWITVIHSTFPNLTSLAFTLKLPKFPSEFQSKDQAYFLQCIAKLLSNLKQLQILRIVLKSEVKFDFGDETDPDSLYQAFKVFLTIPKLNELVMDFGPEHLQEVPERLRPFLIEEMNRNCRSGNVEILQTLEFSGVREYPHIAYCRRVYSDLGLGFYQCD